MSNAFLGKTSLAKALQGNPCDTAPKETTIGIDFYKWTLFDIEVLIIDCAGERKYMLTHQLFLSAGASIILSLISAVSYIKISYGRGIFEVIILDMFFRDAETISFLFVLCSERRNSLMRHFLYIDQSMYRH